MGSTYLDNHYQRQSYIGHKKRVKLARRKGFPIPLPNPNTQMVESSSLTRLNNAKAAAMEYERSAQIERHNQKLYLKMKEIETADMSTLDDRHM